MKFAPSFLGAALLAVVSATPTQSAANIAVSVVDTSSFTPLEDGAAPFVSAASGKAKRAAMATLVVDIWQNDNRGGRHEGLITDTQRCYNLGNGWNDEITSLSVPSGFGCIFYRNSGCNSNDNTLTVPGGNYISNLGQYDFNDKISSYLCYN